MRKSKKNNNLLINIVISIGIIFLIISLVIMCTKQKPVDNHIVEIDYETYQEIINRDEYSIILLTSPTCIHCQKYKPNVNYVADDYDLTIYDLNIYELKEDQFLEIRDKYSVLKDLYDSNGNPTIKTPTTIITKNGEEVDSLLGEKGYTEFLNILKKNEIVK